MTKKKKSEQMREEEELLVAVEAIIRERRAERERLEPHTLTVFDTKGDYICDVPFSEPDWNKLLEASIQMFVTEAIRQLIKRETGKDFG